MNESTPSVPDEQATIDLLALYRDPKVNQVSTFGALAAELDPNSLASGYRRVLDAAPRRRLSGKSYFVEHSGIEGRADESNRREEHLALALFEAFGVQSDGPAMSIGDGRWLRFLDYQTPLKARRTDNKIGKVDLFGVTDEGRPTVVELKVHPEGRGLGNTPLLAYLEALAYCAIVEANAVDIAKDAEAKFGLRLTSGGPALVVMAPDEYWMRYLSRPRSGSWWPRLKSLAADTGMRLGLETHFLALRGADFTMGTSTRKPVLADGCTAVSLDKLAV